MEKQMNTIVAPQNAKMSVQKANLHSNYASVFSCNNFQESRSSLGGKFVLLQNGFLQVR